MRRPFTTFIGIDLGGSRGKTTALARLSIGVDRGPSAACEGAQPRDSFANRTVQVDEVTTRHPGGEPWVDDLLIDYLARARELRTGSTGVGEHIVIALNAPLTQPACVRCVVPACPGVEACVDPAVMWLRSVGRQLLEGEAVEDRDSIAAVPARGFVERYAPPPRRHRMRIAPYSQRACELVLGEQGLVSRDVLGQATGPVAARAQHLRRRLQALGFVLGESLLEVSPAATVTALFDARRARGYKRDADPWETRAGIIEELRDLRFATSSRLSREEVLRNDHCFEALLSGYTGYLWARDGWTMPADGAEVFATDGWIWAPPRR